VWFGEVVTGLLGLLCPIKTRHVVNTQLKTFHRAKTAWSLTDTDEAAT
jgi:hypothetical protein